MDEDRRIRFLVAPVLFLASIGWGTWLDPYSSAQVLETLAKLPKEPVTVLVAAFVGGGIMLFASGFVIGTINYALLRGGSVLWQWSWSKQHEVAISEEILKMLWSKLNIPGEVTQSDELYIGVTFDHGVLQEKHKGVHQWLVRRWSAVSVNSTSITGLVMSLCIGPLAGIQLSPRWWIPVIVVIIAFLCTGIWAWRDTMGMLTFQAKLYQPNTEMDRVTT